MTVLPGRLNPIQTSRLKGGILAAARPLDADYDTWRQGVSFNSSCNPTPGLTGCINPADAVNKDIAAIGDPNVFEPFLAYSGRECSTWMRSEDILLLAQQGFDATISTAFALQLQTAPVGASPSLNSEATDLTLESGSVDITNSLSALMQATCECGMSDLVIHVNLRAIPFMAERHLIWWDLNTGVWRYGPYTISADCYSSTGPESAGTPDEPEDGSAVWMYVTGPVEYALGPQVEIEGQTERQNQRSELVEALGILRFDPCCTYAILAGLF